MKSILLVSKLPPPYYGTTIWTQILLKSDLRQAFRLEHFNNNIHKDFTLLGKPNIFSFLNNLVLYYKYAIVLFRVKTDLIFLPISQTTAGFLKDSVYIIIGRIFRRKILLILHGSNFINWLNGSSMPVRSYTLSVLKVSQGIVVLGNNLRGLFAEIYPDNRIFASPNGGNYTYPRRIINNKIRLLYLGNLIPSKGISDVLKSLLHLLKYSEKLECNVGGVWFDEEYKKKCLAIAERVDIPFVFHGQVTGEIKYQLFADADIFIFPPVEPEGHPYVIVEAMAAGLPIISTDKGAITESVKDGINGYIVEPGNPDQIAEKIAYLIEHPKVRARMGKESRRLYEENFTEEKMIEKLSNAFNSILEV